MTTSLVEPSATASVVELADWLELKALLAPDASASVHDLMRDITRSGTAEVLDADPASEDGLTDPDDETTTIDRGGDAVEALGQGAIDEIDHRVVACGGAYPFTINDHGVLTRNRRAATSPYVFMLLLTAFGGKAGPAKSKPEHLFEELSEVAAAEYFGWVDDHAFSFPFGFPRRMTAVGFEDAVNDLCGEMAEGQGCRTRPTLAKKKDAGLDLVVLRAFPDHRAGQLVGFGQCATGGQWRSKRGDLNPDAFVKLWMQDTIAVTPMRLFFVPHAIEEDEWLECSLLAGIVFDRCRIAYHTTPLDEAPLDTSMKAWSAHVLAAKSDA